MSESQEQTPAQKLIGTFLPKMVALTDDVLFGDIWERTELSKRDRSLITVAALIAGRTALQQEATPETPDIHLIFNPEGLSNHELEKLAELGTVDALEKLRQALDAHTRRLVEVQQSKTGRNALVSAQKKRVSLLQKLITACEQRMNIQQEICRRRVDRCAARLT